MGPMRDPRGALRDFYEGEDRRGEQLCDPPILAGKRVVPLVIADLPKKGTPRRLYAIRFLGNGRYSRALPVLQQLLGDDEEGVAFGVEALRAIYQISPHRAGQLALAYLSRVFRSTVYRGGVAAGFGDAAAGGGLC